MATNIGQMEVDQIKYSDINDPSIEQKFLSCLIKKPHLIVDAQQIIFPHFFLYYANKAIYVSMLQFVLSSEENEMNRKVHFTCDNLYYNKKYDFDSEQFEKAIKRFNFSSFKDYHDFLSKLPVEFKSFSEYCNVLRNNGIRYQLFSHQSKFKQKLLNWDMEESLEQMSEEYLRGHQDIILQTQLDKPFEKIGESFTRFIDSTASRIKNNQAIGISSGFEPLDNALNCFQRGNLYIIAARPKTGKSTFLLKISDNICKQNIPVLYIDTEMDTDEVALRLGSLYSKIDNYWIINGTYTNYPDEEKKIENAKVEIGNLPFYHIFRPGIQVQDLTSTIKMWLFREVGFHYDVVTGKNRLNDCVVVFDYIKVSKRSKYIKDYQILGEMTTQLKDLAGRYGFPLLTAVQNNRSQIKEMGGQVINAELGVANSDEILQYTNYLLFLDKIRDNYNSVFRGVDKKIYHNYLMQYTDDKFLLEVQDIATLTDEAEQNKKLKELFGNRLLSIVAGRQSAVHEDNNYFTLNMDFAHSDVEFNGELAYSPIGKKRTWI